MTFFSIFLIAVFAFLISYFLTRWLTHYLRDNGMFDIPNQRSSHSTPTPRGGGIAIITGFLFSIGALRLLVPAIPLPGHWFFAGVLLLMAVGFIDDKRSVSPVLRFTIHALAVGLVVYETGGFTALPLPTPFTFSLEWAAIPLTFFWALAVMNIYNFLDGIDGYAGAQAFIAGLAFFIFDAGGVGAVVGTAIAFSALGFLILNWHPAKIFMGDVGSVTLGFIFAVLPLYITAVEAFIGNFATIIFLWFFLSDGAFTIIKRLIQGKKIWQAHREHLYQEWVIKGRRHDKVVLEVMVFACLLSGFFFLIYFIAFDGLIVSLALAILMFLVYLYRVKKYRKRYE